MAISLNNGIFLRDTSYKASSHIDSYHLTAMLGSAEPQDLGSVDLWAMTQKVEMPLYQMASFGGKNTILVIMLEVSINGKLPWHKIYHLLWQILSHQTQVKVLMELPLKLNYPSVLFDMVILSLMTSTMD